jgi:hypothetical protein
MSNESEQQTLTTADVAKIAPPPKFKRKAIVVRPLFKMRPGVEYYFKLVGPFHLGKKIDDSKEPATLCNVVDLTTGEEGQIICGKLLREQIAESYPNDSFVGKSFAMEFMRVPDKRYNVIKTLNEIEPEEAQTSAPKSGAPAGGKK